ncbi:MAG TPA: carboxymuconolactone decarboxylase family protein [Povalibacter sp.]|uniref:carboxymuconolactone decarboxylase family protein n=1 Tax=Povalibacter sp. TaxID=1962978 RepID=UPI002CD8FDCF|nr:carboxymuconolactone decarboxylase family protein [Povalibacter sp.]HMN43672.1 carboxymuconolactone decarboxylase family protein [Povalibacter sp.]
MTDHPPRLEPILPSHYDAVALDAMSTFPGARDFLVNAWQSGRRDIAGLHLMGALLHHPELCKAFLAFEKHVFSASSLPFRERELAILRISWLQRCEYEYAQHLPQGRKAGLSEIELQRIPSGSAADGWSAQDADLLRGVEELHRDARLADDTWSRLSRCFDTRQMMDFVLLVGCFGSLCAFANSVNVQLEEGIAPLDAVSKVRLGLWPVPPPESPPP